jgi:hypothetical protein
MAAHFKNYAYAIDRLAMASRRTSLHADRASPETGTPRAPASGSGDFHFFAIYILNML